MYLSKKCESSLQEIIKDKNRTVVCECGKTGKDTKKNRDVKDMIQLHQCGSGKVLVGQEVGAGSVESEEKDKAVHSAFLTRTSDPGCQK